MQDQRHYTIGIKVKNILVVVKNLNDYHPGSKLLMLLVHNFSLNRVKKILFNLIYKNDIFSFFFLITRDIHVNF